MCVCHYCFFMPCVTQIFFLVNEGEFILWQIIGSTIYLLLFLLQDVQAHVYKGTGKKKEEGSQLYRWTPLFVSLTGCWCMTHPEESTLNKMIQDIVFWIFISHFQIISRPLVKTKIRKFYLHLTQVIFNNI